MIINQDGETSNNARALHYTLQRDMFHWKRELVSPIGRLDPEHSKQLATVKSPPLNLGKNYISKPLWLLVICRTKEKEKACTSLNSSPLLSYGVLIKCQFLQTTNVSSTNIIKPMSPSSSRSLSRATSLRTMIPRFSMWDLCYLYPRLSTHIAEPQIRCAPYYRI